MGKGDSKTTRGKRYRSSYGNKRPHATPAPAASVVSTPKAPGAKKTAAKKKA